MRYKRTLSLLLLTIIFSALAYGQVETKGEIRGAVVDANNEALPGVSVTLSGEKLLQRSITAISDSKGSFHFRSLVPGNYRLDLTLAGFNSLVLETVMVNAGVATPIHATLTATKGAHEVIVVATAPQIETESPQILTSFTSQVIETLPAPARRFNDVMNVTPGFYNDTAYGEAGQVENTGTSYGSATNEILIDGLDVGNPNFGYTTVNPIYETVEEVQSVGVGAGAEYGNFIGAAVNIVTKSGTNSFHGSLTSVYSGSGSGFYADNSGGIIDLKYPDYKYSTEVSGTLGGPIVKEKLFFFLAGDYTWSKLMPATAIEFERHKDPRDYAKLDWLVNNKNTFSAMFMECPTWIYNQGVRAGVAPTAALDQHVSMEVAIANWQTVFNNKTFLNIKFATFKDKYDIIAATPGIPQYTDYGTGWVYGSEMYEGNWPSSRTDVYGILNHYIDDLLGTSHELKLGLEYERGVAGGNYDWSGGGFFYSLPLGDGTTLWEAYQGGNRVDQGRINRPQAYLQDNIKAGNKVFLNLGVRYEVVSFGARDFTGNVFQFHNLSPRLGFSYDIGGNAKSVIHGSFGIYYNNPLVSNFAGEIPGTQAMYIYDITLPDAAFDPTAQNIKDRLSLICQPANLVGVVQPPEPIAVDPNLKCMRSDVYNIGFAQQLTADLALSVDYIYKRDGNRYMIKTSGQHTYTAREWTDPWLGRTITVWDQTDSNPDTDPTVTNSHWEKLRHNLLMVVLRKQFRNNWSLMASYVYQHSKSNVPDPEGDLFGSLPYNVDTDPEYTQNPLQWGYQWDRMHQFKLTGSYFAPLGFLISANLRIASPMSWAPQVASSVAGVTRSIGSVYLLLEPRGDRRGPLQTNLDLRAAKTFTLGRTHLEAQVNVFNVFNIAEIKSIDAHPYGLYSTGQSRFGLARYIFAPRTLQLGLTWRF
jgi:hypothetical protein